MIDKIYPIVNMRPKNLNNFLFGSILFLAFLLLTLVESRNVFSSQDLQITVFLQKIIPRSLDIPLSLISLLGGIELTSLLVCFLFYAVFRKEKKLLFSLILFAAVIIFELAEKFLIYHPVPPKMLVRYALFFSTPEYITSRYSFPSGHVSRTIFLAVATAFVLNRQIKNGQVKKGLYVFLATFSLLMIISRIYLGEHWASDVLGGMLLGAAMSLLAMVYY